MESKDYEMHSETIIIPPAYVALRCEQSFIHLGVVKGYARASILVNKTGFEPQQYALPTGDKGNPENQDQTPL
jgi:hypothetical protein